MTEMENSFKLFTGHFEKSLRVYAAFILVAAFIAGVNYYLNWNYKPGKPHSNLSRYIESEYGLKVKSTNIVVGSTIGAGKRAVWFIGTINGLTDIYFIPVQLSSGHIPIASSVPVNVSKTNSWDETTFSVYQDTVAFFNGHSIITARPFYKKQTSFSSFIRSLMIPLKNIGLWKIKLVAQYTPDEKWEEKYRLISRNTLQILTCDNLKKCLISMDISNSLAENFAENQKFKWIIEPGQSELRKKIEASFLSIISHF